MIAIKNILVATDFSEASEVALDYGRNLARAYGARLHVLHVVEDLTMRYASDYIAVLPNIQRDLERAAQLDMDKFLTADDRALPLEVVVETRLTAAGGITEYAATNDIDLIIVGTHGRGALKQLMMGAAAERVVRTAPCPVLAVRSREREFITPDQIGPVARAPESAMAQLPPKISHQA